MKRAALIVLLILCAWAIALLTRWPAAWAIAMMQPLPLSAPIGTLWRGSAQPVAANTAAAIPRLTWRWRPGDLRQGRFAHALTLSGAAHHGNAILSIAPLADWRIDVARLNAPLHALPDWFPAAAIRPRGDLTASTLTVAHNGKAFTAARGVLQWRNAGLPWPASNRLGVIQAQPEIRHGALRLNITGNGGQLDLDGWLELAPDLSRFDLQIQLNPTPNLPAQDRQWLNAALPRQADGRFLLSFGSAF